MKNIVVVALLAALTTLAGCSLVNPPPAVANAAAVPLLGTQWRLVQHGRLAGRKPVLLPAIHRSSSTAQKRFLRDLDLADLLHALLAFLLLLEQLALAARCRRRSTWRARSCGAP